MLIKYTEMSHQGCVTLTIFSVYAWEIITLKTFSNYLYTPLAPETDIFHQTKQLQII